MKRKHWTIPQKQAVVEDYLKSGRSLKVIAKKYRIGESTLHIWSKKYGNGEPVEQKDDTTAVSDGVAKLYAYGDPKAIVELYNLEIQDGVSHGEALEYIIHCVRWGCNQMANK